MAGADRHLLFGLLALQNGLIEQGQLVAAFQAWTVDKSRSLAGYLEARGDLDADALAGIDAVVALHIRKHDGVEKSLAAVSAGTSTREKLAALADPDVDATLSHLGPGSDPIDDPYRTTTHADDVGRTGRYQVGSATSDGQRFRVLRPHAAGGLGAVFVAVDSELNREVALKEILGHHADDPTSRQRFLLEAEITGGLEHPGIVPVYGLGSYGDGRPYYAMRFIRGDSLKEAIERFHDDESLSKDPGRRSLELRKLLRRFTDICNAIEYAHSRGVLHRDIKPGNVIVGKYGETLVVDWGLAKATGKSEPTADEGTLAPSSASGSAETLPGQTLGTPAYMSPEQARGDNEALGPRSDVYSLGATLYCLLTGKAPFEGPVRDVLSAVREGRFPPPRSVDCTIDKALEAICLKAMAASIDDRYTGCRDLADDIEHWLADERVEAYTEPWTRSLARWLSRHRTGVTGAAAALLVGLIGLGSVAAVQTRARNELDRKNGELTRANMDLDVQRKQAEANATEAINAVRKFRDAVTGNEELKKNPALEGLRNVLLKAPLAFFRSLRDRLQADRDTRPETLVRLAEASSQLGALTNEIGDRQASLMAYRESLSIYQRLAEADPSVTEFQSGLASSYDSLGLRLRDLGKPDDALKAHESALAVRRKLAEANPAITAHQSGLAGCHNNIGSLLEATGKPAEAKKAFESALAIQRKLVDAHPNVTGFRRGLAGSHNNVGFLLRATGKPADALKAQESALAIWQKLTDAHPTVTEFRRGLANSYNNIGDLLYETGKPVEALKAHESALAIGKTLAAANPTVIDLQNDLTHSYNSIANLLSDTGKPAEALKAYEASLEIRRRLAVANPSVARFQADLAAAQINIAILLGDTGKPAEALKVCESALVIFQKVVDADPSTTKPRSDLASCYNLIGVLSKAARKPTEAMKAYDSALGIRQKLAEANPTVTPFQADLAASYGNIGNLLAASGRPAEALKAHESALAIRQKLVDTNPTVTGFQAELARSHNAIGNLPGEAARKLKAHESALAIRQKLADAHPTVIQYRSDLAASHINIAAVFRAMGKPTEALKAYEMALPIQLKLASEHPESPGFSSPLGSVLAAMARIDHEANRSEAARARLKQAIDWQRKALAVDPANQPVRSALASYLTGLIEVTRALGDSEGAADAARELERLRESDPAILALDARLAAIIRGEQQPRDEADRLRLGQRAYDKALHATAARLWAEALAANPKLGDDRQALLRYNVACAAALAGSGKGKDDPKPVDVAKARLRAQALNWLKAELEAWDRHAKAEGPGNKELVAKTLAHWKQDTDLAGVREPKALEALTTTERKEWQALWAGVDELLLRVTTTRT